jgi:hypothetical protein
MESDTEFLTATLAQYKVSVWYREDPDPIGRLMAYGMEKFTPESIKLSGSYFIRSRLSFEHISSSPSTLTGWQAFFCSCILSPW